MSFPRSMRSSALIALLAMSVLFAQMLGFVHGIAHAGWPPGTVHSMLNEALFDEGDEQARSLSASVSAEAKDHVAAPHAHDLHHSCAAYDAATLSAVMHFNFPVLPLLPPVRVLALWQAFSSWDAPLNCHFSSRAPPR